jgi:outer membrane protein TolC
MRVFRFLPFVFLISIVCHTRTLDWQSSVALVPLNNPEWSAAHETFQATQVLENAAKSGFLPTVSASVGSQNLFAGFSDFYKLREAKQNTLIAELQWRQTKAKISYDFKSAYAGLLYAQENVILSQKILERRKENLNIVELRFNSGRENKGSLLLAEAYYQQAVYDSIQAGLQMDVAQNALAQVLGISVMDEKISVAKDVPAIELADDKSIDFKKLAVQTLDYRRAIAQAEAARFTHQQTKATYYPSLDLTGTLGKTDSQFPPENDRWSIGLNLTFPLYSGGRDYANEQSAQYRRIAAEINQSAVSNQALVRVKQAYSQFRLAIERVKVDEKFKNAARMRSEIAKKKYNNGLMTFENWDIVENDLIQREKSALSSLRDRIVGQANWEQVQGLGLWP